MTRAPLSPSDRLPRPMLGAGWHFPVRQSGGRLEMAADERSVRQAIHLILSTGKGERVMRPEFGCGLNRLLFAPNNGATQALAAFEVREALRRWEPRVEILDVAARAEGGGGEVLLIEIACRMRRTDSRFNLVYPFYLSRPLV